MSSKIFENPFLNGLLDFFSEALIWGPFYDDTIYKDDPYLWWNEVLEIKV